MKSHSLFAVALSVLVTAGSYGSASAQKPGATAGDDYPNRPVRILVPQAAGAGIDLQARVIAQKLAEIWGHPGVVENKAGANAIIGLEAAAKAPPDGYTLVYAPVSGIVTNPFIYKTLPYDPLRDFAPITQTVANPLGLVVNPASGLKSLADVVARAKANPGQLHYGSFGIGNLTHLTGELLSTTAGIRMTHVPYKGQTPEIADIASGQLQMGFTITAGTTDLIASGKLNLLATFDGKRDELFPDTPTATELGFPGVVMLGWSGLLAPAGTPPRIIAKLHADMMRVLKLPEVKDAIVKQGSRVAVSASPEDFAHFIKAELDKYQAVIKAAGLEGSQ